MGASAGRLVGELSDETPLSPTPRTSPLRLSLQRRTQLQRRVTALPAARHSRPLGVRLRIYGDFCPRQKKKASIC